VDANALVERVGALWEQDVLPSLTRYMAIPNVSPAYDPGWVEAGHMAEAVELVRAWCTARPIESMTVTVHELDGRTPVIVCDIPAFGAGSTAGADDTVLLYGHLDKQPPMEGWLDGLGPWTPVRRDEKLYGRGGADDGYAGFASLAAIEAVRAAGGSHARCVLLIEASEESGSPDLPAHVAALGDQLGSPSLVVCLDSGCATYDRVWATTSLRGLAGLTVTCEVLTQGVHSGGAGGVVPSSFRILRALLDRIEDAATGDLLLAELHTAVPADRAAQVAATAVELGAPAAGTFPFVEGVHAIGEGDPEAQLLARTWGPSLAYVGADGLPPTSSAGNVLRASTSLKLSFRLPPNADAQAAVEAVERALTTDVPHGARITLHDVEVADGWNAPAFAPWLEAAMEAASLAAFGQPARTIGEGGSIPFMGMLGASFPEAQFLVTGVLGPGSNAHGPNEFLHVPYATKLTAAVADILDAHATRSVRA
jgi:acetylornithine deacetylase/succinyl-diaminopimelate desuccinylase-like protein